MTLKHYENIELNPEIRKERVNVAEYSSSDLNTYYSGTILLYLRSGEYVPCYVSEVNSEKKFVIKTIFYSNTHQGWRTNHRVVEPERLFKFVVPTGFYLDAMTQQIFSYSYGAARSYKKGLKGDSMRIVKLARTAMPHGSVLKSLLPVLYPIYESKDGSCKIISTKLALCNGLVYSYSKHYTVGQAEGNNVTTPFREVAERINNFSKCGGLTCQIIQ